MSSEVSTLLVADDDPGTRDLLQAYLTQQGFVVMTATDAASVARATLRNRVDLIVLDAMLPGEDGLSILRRMRAFNDTTPVIMLTSKSGEIDRIVGLEMGADDYLSKPFNPRELAARIHAVLRRRQIPAYPTDQSHDKGTVQFGPYQFDLDARTLLRDGRCIALTSGEYAVLRVLVRHPRTPLSRERLMQLAHGKTYQSTQRSLDVQVARLRKLIEPDPQLPRIIQTVWGIGYVYVPDETTDDHDP